MLKRRMGLAQEQGLYRQVEYIQTQSGLAYKINIGTNSNHGVHGLFEYEFLESVASGSGKEFTLLHSTNTTAPGRCYCSYWYQNSSENGVQLGVGGSYPWYKGTVVGAKHTFDVSVKSGNAFLKIDGTSVLSHSGSFSSSAGSCNIIGDNNPSISTKIYSAKIYNPDNDSEVAFNFIPVVLTSNIPENKCADSTLPHSAGTAGLWDLVEDKFYANSGTGTFVTP